MIKLSKYLYIHWLTVLLFVFAYITRTLEYTFMMYSVMILHELAHALSAKFLRIDTSKIILYPFGVNITLKTRVLCSLCDSLILYLSGPMINAVAALVAYYIAWNETFIYNNLAIFIFNMLPVLPLDGGRITEAIMLKFYNAKACRTTMIVISAILSLAISGLLIIYGELNINTFTLMIFMVGNCIMSKEKYNRDYLRELMLTKKIKTKRAQLLIVEKPFDMKELLNYFSPRKHTAVFISNTKGEIIDVKSDKEVIFDILK
ncbi:MAG: hypothetical protein KIG65_04895 [Eubacteriales bacterium]|nr:hypothetical protein [Eubacteriales bacterium]